MAVGGRRGLVLWVVVFRITLCTGNQGCRSGSDINLCATSGVNLNIFSYNSRNCIMLKDPTTFSRFHGYPSAHAIEILQGRHPRFICSVQPHSDCQNITVTLQLGQAAACDPLLMTKSLFKVEKMDNIACNTDIECKTILLLNVTSVEGMSQVQSVFRIRRNSDINFTIFGFQSLELTYQTCMDEVLEFQIPMSANVPLNVTCKEHNGPMLLKEECLTPESTSKHAITTKGIAATDSPSSHINTAAITTSPSDSNAKDMKCSKSSHFALTIAFLSMSTISSLGVMVWLIYRLRRKQRQHKNRSPQKKQTTLRQEQIEETLMGIRGLQQASTKRQSTKFADLQNKV